MRLIDADALNGYELGLISPKAQKLFHKIINDAPTQKTACRMSEWIPLNDRLCLPEKDGEYLVTVRGTTNRYYIILCSFALNLYEVDKYDFDNRRGIAGFYEYDSEYGYYEVLNAVAWMPRPEPYRASPTGAESEE